MCDLNELISLQKEYIDLSRFKNELMTMRELYERPKAIREDCDQLFCNWLNMNKDGSDDSDYLTQKSHRLRVDGNKLLNDIPRDPIGAANLYTKALLAAPANSETLALAYANRATALIECGYFRQAYDDCVCALEQGYPEQLRHKIVARQAKCAQHLGDVMIAQRHVTELGEITTLNERFAKDVLNLRIQQETLEQMHEEKPPETLSAMSATTERSKTTVVQMKNEAGRYMVALRALREKELIFSENASSFVPVHCAPMLCQHCAATQIIPFPCHHCYCRVVYCSVKCRSDHASIHAYECAGYRRIIFAEVGIGHLALRTILDNLPPVMTLLRDKSTADALWLALVGANDNSIMASDTLEYAETLRLVHHINRMTCDDLGSYALMANFLVVYLKQFTEFFNLTESLSASRDDWELITAALILRHIGQFIVNASVCNTLIVSPPRFSNSFILLLQNDLWTKGKPLCLRLGCLHKFSHSQNIIVGNFPYLSTCNHACEQSFQSRFSGRTVSTFAISGMKTGTEITNCYTLDYRKLNHQQRQNELKQIYNFYCKCLKCDKSANPNEEYNNLHSFRCDRPNCKKVFFNTIGEVDLQMGVKPKCSECGKCQSWNLFIQKFVYQLERVGGSDQNLHHTVLESFNQLGNWFLDYNVFRVSMAGRLVREFLTAFHDNVNISDEEFDKLVPIAKFALAGIAAQSSTFSIEYVSILTYMWDLIALGKYKCTRAEWKPMLHAIDILSDENKTIFMHYYEDYIEPLLLS